MNQYDVLFFDIDGTLVDSNAAHAEVWSRACSAFDFPKPPAFFQPLIGMGGEFILPLVDPSLSSDSEVGKLISQERKRLFLADHARTVEAFPRTRELFEACKAQSVRCVIATSATSEETELLLKAAKVTDLAEEVVCESDAERAKPASDIIHAALKKVGVSPERAVLVGDTSYDIEAARHAGVATIALRCGGSTDERLKDAIAIFDDPSDLLDHLSEVLTLRR